MQEADLEVFFSVIIPVYNAEKFLHRCMDSVLRCPASTPLEVILVDDGSTDGSAALCASYAEKDVRVRTLSQANGGASAARNAGIRAARGEYLLFVDSDDAVHSDAFSELFSRMAADGDCDVAFLTADKRFPGQAARPYTHQYKKTRIFRQEPTAVLSYLTAISHYPISPCVKLLRRRFVLENGLFFTEGMVCEDVDHTYRVLLAAQSFNYFNVRYYVVHVRAGSVMTAPENAQKRFDATLWIIEEWSNRAKSNDRRAVIHAFLAAQYVYLCAMYADLPEEGQKRHRQAVAGFSWLLACGVNPRFAAINIFYKVMGLSITARIFRRIFL